MTSQEEELRALRAQVTELTKTIATMAQFQAGNTQFKKTKTKSNPKVFNPQQVMNYISDPADAIPIFKNLNDALRRGGILALNQEIQRINQITDSKHYSVVNLLTTPKNGSYLSEKKYLLSSWEHLIRSKVCDELAFIVISLMAGYRINIPVGSSSQDDLRKSLKIGSIYVGSIYYIEVEDAIMQFNCYNFLLENRGRETDGVKRYSLSYFYEDCYDFYCLNLQSVQLIKKYLTECLTIYRDFYRNVIIRKNPSARPITITIKQCGIRGDRGYEISLVSPDMNNLLNAMLTQIYNRQFYEYLGIKWPH